jgi:3-hydroxyacyl-CoA dehydrogenase/enoyl-CoA hydratase/3-hydroxybutyryl-CoA epimerase
MSDENARQFANWRIETDGDNVVWLCIDKAEGSANVLSGPVLRELAEIIEPFAKSPPRGIVLYSGKQNGFVMGADINEFTTIDSSSEAYDLIRLGQRMMDMLEGLPCPSVAILNGFALGGGLELAMACRYRLAISNEKPIIGLPEVQLGLHPGFGGTVRAVRFSGVRAAMQLMLTGKPITASKALRQGLVDRIAEDSNWRDQALDLIRQSPPVAKAPLPDRILNLAIFRPLVANMLRKQVRAKARPEHYQAP